MNKGALNPAWHKKRARRERRFKWYGRAALATAVLILVILLGSILARGLPGFIQTQISLPITFDAGIIGIDEHPDARTLSVSGFNRLAQLSLKQMFPEAEGDRAATRQLYALIGNNGKKLKRLLVKHPELLGKTQDVWLVASSASDLFFKGSVEESTPESERKLNDRQISWLKQMNSAGLVKRVFNLSFFTQGDSRAPERAGFLGAMIGSAFTLIVCLSVVFPIGVMSAVYLEEFARRNKWVDIIEVNINNLAAVPSIVFGLLGLAVYINMMHLPRSASLVGGMTLALMILPVIIIATRASLKAVPGSIRDAARALGANPLQVVWHHTLPLSMPGIMTGTILGLARAIGETAPLLMIGMVAFVADLPTGFTSPATVMPVQIFLWAGSPEAGFSEKTAAGILLLLVLLLAMNALAIVLRKRFEVRW